MQHKALAVMAAAGLMDAMKELARVDHALTAAKYALSRLELREAAMSDGAIALSTVSDLEAEERVAVKMVFAAFDRSIQMFELEAGEGS